MPWVEVFAVFAVCHLTGDFALQTEWQAKNKRGGLGPSAVARRALGTHVATYTLAFIPAFIWFWEPLGPGVFAVAAIIAGTHLVQDDGRLIASYVTHVKGTTGRRPSARGGRGRPDVSRASPLRRRGGVRL